MIIMFPGAAQVKNNHLLFSFGVVAMRRLLCFIPVLHPSGVGLCIFSGPSWRWPRPLHDIHPITLGPMVVLHCKSKSSAPLCLVHWRLITWLQSRQLEWYQAAIDSACEHPNWHFNLCAIRSWLLKNGCWSMTVNILMPPDPSFWLIAPEASYLC